MSFNYLQSYVKMPVSAYVPRLSVTAQANEGGESLVTTELLGIHALIVFIMVMTTFYAYVLIIHTVTSHEHLYKIQLLLLFFYL